MKVNHQKTIELRNNCGALLEEGDLIKAILWYSNKPVCRLKTIYIHGRYPCVSIYFKKIHIHRLLFIYWMKEDIDRYTYVHHKNGNRLDARRANLELMDASSHQSLHNKGKKLSKDHRRKIGDANKKRKGMKMKKRVSIPELGSLLKKGWTINRISKRYGCDWSTVKARIIENPDLLTPSNS